MNNLLKEIEQAHNIYRTKHFIVAQILSVEHSKTQVSNTLSTDRYFRRTKQRDRDFEKYLLTLPSDKVKRLPSTMYTRTYID